MKEARLYIREDLCQEDYVVARVLCHHRCRIRPGKSGRCGAQENQAGVLSSLVYDRSLQPNWVPYMKMKQGGPNEIR